MLTNRKHIFSLLLLLCSCFCLAQNKTLLDSLLGQLKTNPSDTTKILLLSDICWEYAGADKAQALNYGDKALQLGKQINYEKGIAEAYNAIGTVYLRGGEYDKALENYNNSLQIRKKLGSKRPIAATLSKISVAYQQQGDYQKSLETILQSLKIFEELNDKPAIGYSCNNLGELYGHLNQFEKAKTYYEKAYEIAKSNNDKAGMASVLGNLGWADEMNGNYEKAIASFEQALKLMQETNNKQDMAGVLNNIGLIYRKLNKIHKGLEYYTKALEVSKEIDDKHGIAHYMNNIGNIYTDLKNFDKALLFQNEALKLAKEVGIKPVIKSCYRSLSDLYAKQNDYKKALEFHELYAQLKDSLYDEESTKQIAEMQTKYETEKKEKEKENKLLTEENLLGNLELENQRTQKYILIGSVAFILILSFLFYSRYKLKQKQVFDAEIIRQQGIRSKAIIEAEEKERMRIAKDLHDGIGQTLSAAKINLSGLESVLDPKDAEQRKMFQNAIELIDESVKEVRTISHNMMPNALLKSGLATAVRDFINKISHTDQLKIDLQIHGLNERLESTVETVLFRVLQEIVSNTIKHAKANLLSIQLIRHENEITLMVEDNGLGFDTTKMNDLDGIGLKNIYSRVAYLNGTVTFDSHPGKGTTIIVEIPLKQESVS